MMRVKTFFFSRRGPGGMDVLVRTGGSPTGDIIADCSLSPEQVSELLVELGVERWEPLGVTSPPVETKPIEPEPEFKNTADEPYEEPEIEPKPEPESVMLTPEERPAPVPEESDEEEKGEEKDEPLLKKLFK